MLSPNNIQVKKYLGSLKFEMKKIDLTNFLAQKFVDKKGVEKKIGPQKLRRLKIGSKKYGQNRISIS